MRSRSCARKTQCPDLLRHKFNLTQKSVRKRACIFTEVKTHAYVLVIEFVSHSYFSKSEIKMQYNSVIFRNSIFFLYAGSKTTNN